MVSTRVDLNQDRVARARDLDDLARLLFPGNRVHQRVFLAVFVELKWAEGRFLPALEPVAQTHGVSRRTLQTVRAKMRRLGLIDRVSRFSARYGFREGWALSMRFDKSLARLAGLASSARDTTCAARERKDRDAVNYV